MPPSLAVVLGLSLPGAVAQRRRSRRRPQAPCGRRVRLSDVGVAGSMDRGHTSRRRLGQHRARSQGIPPLGAALRLPREAITRLEIVDREEEALVAGPAIGAAAGRGLGFSMDVDPVAASSTTTTSAAGARPSPSMGGTSAAWGRGSARSSEDVWIPVALDALGPPPRSRRRAGSGLRAAPGGLSLRVSFRF